MPSLPTGCRWLLALLLVAGLSNCQRAAYQFQPLAATPYQVPAPPADSLRVVSEVPASVSSLASVQPRRAYRRASAALGVGLQPALSQATRLLNPLHRLRAVAAVAPVLNKMRPSPGPPDDAQLHHRTRGIAFLLAIFLGGIGAHLFYLGYHKRAVTYLMVSLAGGLLLFVGAVGLLLAIFSSVGGAYLAALLVGTILLAAISLLATVDAIRIITNDLKPKEGEYYPRFFQTRPVPGPQPD
jgi:hypothetical protein